MLSGSAVEFFLSCGYAAGVCSKARQRLQKSYGATASPCLAWLPPPQVCYVRVLDALAFGMSSCPCACMYVSFVCIHFCFERIPFWRRHVAAIGCEYCVQSLPSVSTQSSASCWRPATLQVYALRFHLAPRLLSGGPTRLPVQVLTSASLFSCNAAMGAPVCCTRLLCDSASCPPGWGIDTYQNCSVHATHTAHCGASLRASHREGLCAAVHA